MAEISTKVTWDVDKSAAREVKKASDNIRKEVLGQEDAFDRATRAARENADAVRHASKSAQNYDSRRSKASSRFGVFGDVDTALSTVSSAVGGNELLNFASDISAVTEQFGLMGAALPGTTAGLAGMVGALGLAGVALVGLGIAAKGFIDDMNDQANELKAALAAQEEAALATTDLTRTQAQERIATMEEELAIQQRILEERRAAYEQFEDDSGVLAPALKVFDSREQALADSVGESASKVEQLQKKIAAFNAELEDGNFKADEAATVATERVDIERQIADATEAANAVRSDTASVERENARKQEAAQREAEQAAKKRADALNKLNSDLENAAVDNANAMQDIARSSGQALADLRTQAARDEADAQRQGLIDQYNIRQSFFRDEAAAARDNADAIANIRKQADRDRDRLVRSQDFLGLFDMETQVNQQIEDQQEGYLREREERSIAQAEQLTDLQRSLQQERQERLTQYRRDISDARTAANREQQEQATAYQRQQELARRHYSQQLATLGEYLNREAQLKQQAAQAGVEAAGAAARGGAGGYRPAPIKEGDVLAASGIVYRNNSNTININGARNPLDVGQAVRREMTALGIV